MKAENARVLFFVMLYRPLGRIALLTAFFFGLDGNLRAAIASLAVALWMMWSSLLHLGVELGLEMDKQKQSA
jgi:hypothetical protein